MGCNPSMSQAAMAHAAVPCPKNLLRQAAAVSEKNKPTPSGLDFMCKYTQERFLWAALDNGGTVLLKGSWLVEFAKKGKKLPRRQDLPAEAMWNVAELSKRGTTLGNLGGFKGRNKVHIMALSYCWMEPDHPDPDGEQLKTVAKVIEMRLNLPKELQNSQCHDVAIFIDYACLPQHPRTPEEQNTFDRGLKDVTLWYAHDRVTVLLLTCFPKSRCDDTTLYASRGWPSFEKAVASLIQAPDHIFDLQFLDAKNNKLSQEAMSRGVRPGPCCDWKDFTWKCRVRCTQPLTPPVFNYELAAKKFANEADAEFVKAKYEQTLMELLSSPAHVQLKLAFASPEAAVSLAQCAPYYAILATRLHAANEFANN